MNKFDRAALLLKERGIDGWLIACNEGSDIHSPFFLGVKSHAIHFILVDANGNHKIAAVEMEAPMIKKAVEAMGAKVDVCTWSTHTQYKDIVTGMVSKPRIAVNYGEDALFSDTGQADYIKAGQLHSLRVLAPGTEFVSSIEVIKGMRERKSPEEIAALKEAVKITLGILESVPDWVKVGMTEKDVQAKIDYEYMKVGEPGFDTIVASGPNSADPHHNSSTKKIERGAFLIDTGVRYEQICSDITWTYWVDGTPPVDFTDAYRALYQAKEIANQHMTAGVETWVPDQECRDFLASKGYDHEKLYIHGLGHAIGYEVHDIGNRCSWKAPKGRVFLEDSIYSNEPGLYWQGRYGLRLEDDVVIRKDRCEQVSYNPKDPLLI